MKAEVQVLTSDSGGVTSQGHFIRTDIAIASSRQSGERHPKLFSTASPFLNLLPLH